MIELDPVALLMLKGFDRTVKMGIWSKENLRIHNKWFDGERKFYENELRQFHVDFLSEVEKLEVEDKKVEPQKEIKNPKIKIFIDDMQGIYRETENGILSYKIKASSKRFHTINFLFGKDRVKTSVLATATIQPEDLVRKEIKETNELFCENLKVANVLISKIGTGGYALNNKDFNIIKNQ